MTYKEALEYFASREVFVKPENWNSFKEGSAPTLEDCKEVSHVAKAALDDTAEAIQSSLKASTESEYKESFLQSIGLIKAFAADECNPEHTRRLAYECYEEHRTQHRQALRNARSASHLQPGDVTVKSWEDIANVQHEHSEKLEKENLRLKARLTDLQIPLDNAVKEIARVRQDRDHERATMLEKIQELKDELKASKKETENARWAKKVNLESFEHARERIIELEARVKHLESGLYNLRLFSLSKDHPGQKIIDHFLEGDESTNDK